MHFKIKYSIKVEIQTIYITIRTLRLLQYNFNFYIVGTPSNSANTFVDQTLKNNVANRFLTVLHNNYKY